MTMKLIEKLANIQIELKAPKSQFNNFGKYKYRTCEDVLEAVKPLCFNQKTTLVMCDDLVEIENRFYIKATATIFDWETEAKVSATAYARECEAKKGMDDSQLTGSTSSYARKYALNALFNIDDSKDSDFSNNGETKEKPDEYKETALVKKQRFIFDFYKDNKVRFEPILKSVLKGRKIKDISENEANDLIDLINVTKHTMGDFKNEIDDTEF